MYMKEVFFFMDNTKITAVDSQIEPFQVSSDSRNNRQNAQNIKLTFDKLFNWIQTTNDSRAYPLFQK